MRTIHQYNSYHAYLKHQIRGRKHWFKKLMTSWYRSRRIARFQSMFEELRLPVATNCLCIGARYGEEVVAGRNCFHECVGIDLIDYPPLVQYGDMHDLEFPLNSFDLVYTNVLDHSYNPAQAVAEMRRVLCPGGIIVLDFPLTASVKKEEKEFNCITFSSPKEIINLFRLNCLSHQCIDVNGPDRVLFGVTDRFIFCK